MQRSTLTVDRESETPKYCVCLPKSTTVDLLFVRNTACVCLKIRSQNFVLVYTMMNNPNRR